MEKTKKPSWQISLKSLRLWLVYVLLCGWLLGELGLAVWFLPGRFETLAAKKEELAKNTAQAQELTATVRLLAEIDRDQLREDLNKALAAIPHEKKTSGLVTGLTTLASSSGIVVKGLEFSPGLISTPSALSSAPLETVMASGVKTIPVAVTLIADRNQMASFLASLRQASQMLGVISVQFGSSQRDTSAVTLPMLIYYQPPKESRPDPKQVKLLTTREREILDALPAEDIFKLPPEPR